MGKGVLSVDSSASSYLRTYAHCSRGRVSVHPSKLIFIRLVDRFHIILLSGLSPNHFFAKNKKRKLPTVHVI